MKTMPHKREMTLATVQYTQAEAIAFCDSKVWETWTAHQIVELQLYQEKLCVPFPVFHKSVTDVLDRDVFIHEFAWAEELQDEFEGKKPKSPPRRSHGIP